MANHCIEVVCANCGACYCLRCGDGNGPNKAIMEQLKDKVEAWQRYEELTCRYCNQAVYESSMLVIHSGV
jgi:hypothetical protein